MKMLAVLSLFIVVLCAMECFGAAAPKFEPEQDQEVTNNNLLGDARKDEPVQEADFTLKEEQELEPRGLYQGACPSGWSQFEAYCYLARDSIKSYADAKRSCRDLGGDLVKINNFEENEYVLQLVRQQYPALKQVWIGLQWQSSAFFWSDASVPVYMNWAPDEPNGNAREPCGHMWTGHTSFKPDRASGYWNDLVCQTQSAFPNGFVCKRLP